MIMTILSANKLISTDLKKLELSLVERSKTQTEMINQLGNHIISSGGKRLRPVILLLSAYACRGELDDKAIDASVVVEFIHAATLLHDDVVDMSQIRHNQDTANIIILPINDAPYFNIDGEFISPATEGSEYEVIMDFDQTIANKIKQIAIEIQDLPDKSCQECKVDIIRVK